MDAEAAAFFKRMVDDAAAIATSGRWDAVNVRLKFLAQNPGSGNGWWVQVFIGLCDRTFSEYLALKHAFADKERGDVALLAWRARNLFELSVWATYCARSRENARRLYEDAGRDVRGVFDAFIKWGTKTAQGTDWLIPIEKAVDDRAQEALSAGIESLEGRFKEVRDAAEECGIESTLTNKMLSKFAHPTAMRILAGVDEAREALQRETFYSDGCLFFLGAFHALEGQLVSQSKANA